MSVTNKWRSVALAGLLASAQTYAAPSVNVQLRTSFDAPPYLIELLETAAEENATSYFPLLDRLADGYFDKAKSDQELYNGFRGLLQKDGHLDAEGLSSFDLALSLHSAAPRIEAHFQYYNTSVLPAVGPQTGDGCNTWVYVPFTGQRYCSPDMEESSAQSLGKAGDALRQLPFDRLLGNSLSDKPAVLYTDDVTSESFKKFHKTLSKTARDGKTSYRLRYRASHGARRPLTVSGYGVELALKRTDYIVIDDRKDGEEQTDDSTSSQGELSEEDITDLRPLSASELRRLSVKAASFVMASEAPFDTLLRLTQDFPKHSSSIAATNASKDFLDEHYSNRELQLPVGMNALWINGVQIMGRDVNGYALLEHLRRERKLINGVKSIGLSGPEAIALLSNEAITASQLQEDVQRYDWRDEIEGGNAIVWMNDIEKDKRYAEWPETVNALLQRTFPGQLPPVRKDIHNLVVPIDFADYSDVTLLTEQLRGFVTRKLPIRFGLVPNVRSTNSATQARVFNYLVDRYGLVTALNYLEKSMESAGRSGYGAPDTKLFLAATEDGKVRPNKETLELAEISSDQPLVAHIKSAEAYLARLGAQGDKAPVFVNGVAVPRSEQWLQLMSQQVGMDLRMVQQAVYQAKLTDEDNVPDFFLQSASPRRNPVVIPEDDKTVRHLNLGELPEFSNLPSLPASKETIERELVHLTVAADLDSKDGFEQLMEALLHQAEHDNVEVAMLHVPKASASKTRLGSDYDKATGEEFLKGLLAQYRKLAEESSSAGESAASSFADRRKIYERLYAATSLESTPEIDEQVRAVWGPFGNILTSVGVGSGQKAFIINGRIVGPMSENTTIEKSDLDALFTYERKLRLLPAALAVEALHLADKASDPLSFARVSNLISLSLVSDVPEGIFEAAPTVRTDLFTKWNGSQTTINVGNRETATLQIYATIDPASELAQKWVPILKVLSDLEGVYTCMFINPKDALDEIPIKRFYRQVLSSKPAFDNDGALSSSGAHFSGLPADALLNMGMELPPSWLVAPKDTVHDLDNIKLSAVKAGQNIDAVYELEHILIEGHSRDVTLGPPPRGVQLVLGTELDPHFADTIIMANLGYFQFKANPGLYNITLQKGRSEEIFNIDSAGTLGYEAQAGDETTEIALMNFRGATIYPRLSRKPGMEEEDVLEPSKTTMESLAEGADNLLAQVGLKTDASKYLSKAARILGSGKTDLSASRHADINIFSVASGHLYERMLNIMMVSVMKHTKHTVKFWFIEQFLSPSFKDFLPIMAEEYGFKYEMVTYKWPHWLRAQKEKQREIWGYKILFLDVLFPLDLDKVIFVDADQIVRTDMYELVQHDLEGAPYGFTPMCDSRTEMEGFRFWKQGYWKNFLRGLPYHISALYVVDLKKFREVAAGDRLRQNYHQLSADPNSLSNLDQDLPNHMQSLLPIHSLPQEWLWCETWCSDESLKDAKTIDLCNNPQTKEPKLDRARRQVPEWTAYDDEIAAVAKKHKEQGKTSTSSSPEAGVAGEHGGGDESIQERLQREDAERERKKKGEQHVRDEL